MASAKVLTVTCTSSSKCSEIFTKKLAAAAKWLKDHGLCDWIHVIVFQPYRGLPYARVAFRNRAQVRRSPQDQTVIDCSRALAMMRALKDIHSNRSTWTLYSRNISAIHSRRQPRVRTLSVRAEGMHYYAFKYLSKRTKNEEAEVDQQET